MILTTAVLLLLTVGVGVVLRSPGRLLARYPKLTKFRDIGNIDKVFRIVQYLGMFLIASLEPFPLMAASQTVIGLIGEVDALRRFFRMARKGIKFIRGPKFIANLLARELKLPAKGQVNYASLRLVFLENLFRILGEACLIAFYFTDHHETFYELEFMRSREETANSIGDWGLTLRIGYSLLVIMSLFAWAINLLRTSQFKIKTNKSNQAAKIKENCLELCGHVMDVLLFKGLLEEDFLTKKTIGLLGVGASLVKLGKSFL